MDYPHLSVIENSQRRHLIQTYLKEIVKTIRYCCRSMQIPLDVKENVIGFLSYLIDILIRAEILNLVEFST